MADFIETTVGYLNLAYVVLIRQGEAGDSQIQMSDGRTFLCHVADFSPVHPTTLPSTLEGGPADGVPQPTVAPTPPPYALGGNYTVPTFRADAPYVAPVVAEGGDPDGNTAP